MGSTTNYLLGADFPHEGFVQRALERHFTSLGFHITPEGHADLVCVHPQTHERWIVEAKGRTAAIGLDFRTGLGQLLQRMSDQRSRYGLAMPNLPQFRRQCCDVKPWVREALGLHWLLIGADGTVQTYSPHEEPCGRIQRGPGWVSLCAGRGATTPLSRRTRLTAECGDRAVAPRLYSAVFRNARPWHGHVRGLYCDPPHRHGDPAVH